MVAAGVRPRQLNRSALTNAEDDTHCGDVTDVRRDGRCTVTWLANRKPAN